MKKPKSEAYDFADTTMRRMFIERLLVLYLGSAFGADWVDQTVTQLCAIQEKELSSIGLDQKKIKVVFAILEAWGNCFYGLNFTYTDHEHGPEFKLTFVDEMDSDPEVIAMRAMMAARDQNN